MRPFAVFGVFLVLIGAVSVLFAFLAYSSSGGACLGGHPCPNGYAAWYEGRVLIWGIFGALLLLFGLWLLTRPARRRWGNDGGGFAGGPGAGPYGAPRGVRRYGGGWGGAGPRLCSRCGARNGPHFQYCHRCGAALAGPIPTVPPTAPPP